MDNPFNNRRHISSTYEQFIRHDVFSTHSMQADEIIEFFSNLLEWWCGDAIIDDVEVASDGILVTYTISHE